MIHVPASIFQEHKLKENIRKTNDKSLAFFAGLFYNLITIIFQKQFKRCSVISSGNITADFQDDFCILLDRKELL